ncbi:hypothetical protein [Natronosalvus halobius]|uniref:hypothetical protein n=1 Tax=Natronosalvus halobius TaxID=2953746 RepID=UPI00209FC6E0|nr:hypothetical protein [Natronosalvus halobius]USZ73548.1 hypothetical protein NGM15_17975 [Natronosalvus halobius]
MGSASSDETTDGTVAGSDGEHEIDETANENSSPDTSAGQSTTSMSATESHSRPDSELQNGDHPTAATRNGASSTAPESDLEVLRALNRFLDDIDTDLPTARERARARDHFDLENRLGEPTTTQAKLGFDYVRDDGIAVDGNSYIGLLKVHPQNWLSLSDQAKRDTMSAYVSFLMSLESSVAVPCYPKTFDLTGHLERFYTAGASRASRGQTPILQYGRKFYIQWANTNIEDEDLKQRDFYIVTRVKADQVHKDLDTGSVLSQLRTLPIIGRVCSGIVNRTPLGGSHAEVRTELCIREVRQRQRRITNTLGRTDVSIERVTDRQETMEILYHYYNHVDPKFEKFSHATKTEDEY